MAYGLRVKEKSQCEKLLRIKHFSFMHGTMQLNEFNKEILARINLYLSRTNRLYLLE